MRALLSKEMRENSLKQTKIGVFIRQPWNLNNGSSYPHKNSLDLFSALVCMYVIQKTLSYCSFIMKHAAHIFITRHIYNCHKKNDLTLIISYD